MYKATWSPKFVLSRFQKWSVLPARQSETPAATLWAFTGCRLREHARTTTTATTTQVFIYPWHHLHETDRNTSVLHLEGKSRFSTLQMGWNTFKKTAGGVVWQRLGSPHFQQDRLTDLSHSFTAPQKLSYFLVSAWLLSFHVIGQLSDVFDRVTW